MKGRMEGGSKGEGGEKEGRRKEMSCSRMISTAVAFALTTWLSAANQCQESGIKADGRQRNGRDGCVKACPGLVPRQLRHLRPATAVTLAPVARALSLSVISGAHTDAA